MDSTSIINCASDDFEAMKEKYEFIFDRHKDDKKTIMWRIAYTAYINGFYKGYFAANKIDQDIPKEYNYSKVPEELKLSDEEGDKGVSISEV